MKFRKQRGSAAACCCACHPLPARSMTGRPHRRGGAGRAARAASALLVAATVLIGPAHARLGQRPRRPAPRPRGRPPGQAGRDGLGRPGHGRLRDRSPPCWSSAALDRQRHRSRARPPRAVAAAWASARSGSSAPALLAPVGRRASACYPAFLSYGGLGRRACTARPPTLADHRAGRPPRRRRPLRSRAARPGRGQGTGLHHLPLRIALRTGAPRLLRIASACTALVGGGARGRRPRPSGCASSLGGAPATRRRRPSRQPIGSGPPGPVQERTRVVNVRRSIATAAAVIGLPLGLSGVRLRRPHRPGLQPGRRRERPGRPGRRPQRAHRLRRGRQRHPRGEPGQQRPDRRRRTRGRERSRAPTRRRCSGGRPRSPRAGCSSSRRRQHLPSRGDARHGRRLRDD